MSLIRSRDVKSRNFPRQPVLLVRTGDTVGAGIAADGTAAGRG